MVRFIKQEAEEKANEINVSAEEVRPLSLPPKCVRSHAGGWHTHFISYDEDWAQEFNIQKLQQLDAEKAKIRKEYEKKESSGEAKKKM